MSGSYLNQKGGVQKGRVLWFDPNPTDNTPINTEDLNISVSLEATSKNKTMISNNKKLVVVNQSNDNNKDKKISFIRSSVTMQNASLNELNQTSLSTSYTEIQHINNGSSYDGDKTEALGIESINIEFNTSYAPMIKIKMIDVRGASLFSNNGKGDYNFFFELPYPLFNLEIKGFYGKPVEYCLHLIRFNASFNSETGNFEIDCDFIGYTYALLNDMLMGMLRGVQDTKIGDTVFKEIKKEYKPELQKQIVKIDDLIEFIDKGNFSLAENIAKNETYSKQLTTNNDIRQGLDIIKKNILESVTQIVSIFKSNSLNDIIIYEDFYTIILKEDTQNIFNIKNILNGEGGYESISNYNLNVLQESLKSNSIITIKPSHIKYNTNIDNINITKKDIDVEKTQIDPKDSDLFKKITNDTPLGYKEELDKINIINKLYENRDKIENDEINLIIIDFGYPARKIDEFLKIVNDKISDLETKITNELNTKIYEKTKNSSTTTIRNLFRVLGTGVDTFLRTLFLVSSEANKNNANRSAEFKKLTSSSNKEKIDSDSTSKVSPWPEYREMDDDYYTEKYLGTVLNVKNVPELAFTEDLMKTMIEQKKTELENLNKSEIVNPLSETQNWFPISVLDSDMIFGKNNAKMFTNPYMRYMMVEGKQSAEDMLTLVILRGFLLLGFANYNSIDSELIKLHGRLEAWNLKFILDKIISPNDIALIDGINKYKNSNDIISSNNFNDYIFKKNDTSLEYIYIKDDKNDKSYLPVNDKFSKSWWYKNNNIKPQKELIEFVKKNELILAGNQNNYSNYFNTTKPTPYILPNFTPIIPQNNIITNIQPTYGQYTPQTDNSYVNEKSTNDIDNSDGWDGAIYVNLIDKEYIEDNPFNPLENSILIEAKGKTLDNYDNNYANKNIQHKNSKNVLTDKTNTTSYVNPLGIYDGNSVQKSVNTYIKINPKGSELGKESNDNLETTKFDTTGYFFADNRDTPYNNNEMNYLISIYYDSNAENPKIHSLENTEKVNYFNGLKIIETKTKVYFNGKSNSTSLSVLGREDGKRASFKNNYNIVVNDKNKIKEFYIPRIGFIIDDITPRAVRTSDSFDLFGSELYYLQKTKKEKAFLFLHTFPFQGLPKGDGEFNFLDYMMLDFNDSKTFETILNGKGNPKIFGIKQLLRTNNALIKIPKIWALFIGSILWRMDENDDPIKYPDSYNINNPRNDEFLYNYIKNKKNNYCGIQFLNKGFSPANGKVINNRQKIENDYNYARIDETLRGLPRQVKNEFIGYFETWVKGDEWDYLRSELELKNNNKEITNILEFENLYYDLNDNYKKDSDSSNYYYDDDYLKNTITEKVYKNYTTVNLVLTNDIINNGVKQINLYLRMQTNVMGKLINLLAEPVYMQNANPYVWKPRNLKNQTKLKETHHKIMVNIDDFKLYLDNFLDNFKILTSNYKSSEKSKVEEAKKSLFGLQDNDSIRLNIYRTLSAIYQKWIANVEDGNFFSQCIYNKEHDNIAIEERNNKETPRLLDSFRFVDRAFRDLGDKLYVNPRIFVDVIRNNQNATFFDVTNKVLNDNNFLFIPLPTYLNYNNVDDLADAFQPKPNNDYDNISGPSFVCVYVGQVSNNLALESDDSINYPDDGIYVTLDNNNNMIGLPNDFTTSSNKPNPYELNIPIFTVNYGQQNQNYFKDVRLDQKEFTETAESLEIINDLSNQGDKTKETYIGQNLFNVYQKRSYSCEIEMLGNALIQPMMYFQLNNIPMFKGLYLIINVKHTIKPNHMVTTFKGVRVKKYKTPLLDINNVLYVSENNKKTSTTAVKYNTASVANYCRQDTVKLIKDDKDFLKGIKEITDYLNANYECETTINPWDLLGLIEHESACSFKPDITSNNINYGLIQFSNKIEGQTMTYRDKDGSNPKEVSDLIKLTRSEQVTYVHGFIKENIKGKISPKNLNQNKPKLSMGRLYLIVFLPTKVDNLEDIVVSSSSTGREYNYWLNNPSLHENGEADKPITVTYLGKIVSTKGEKYKNLDFN